MQQLTHFYFLPFHYQLFMRHIVMKKSRKTNQEDFEKASPYSRVKNMTSEQIPPFFVAIGSHDSLVSVSDNIDFMAQIQDKRGDSPNIPDKFVMLHGAQHAFNYLVSPRSIAFGDAVLDFITTIKSKHPTPKL